MNKTVCLALTAGWMFLAGAVTAQDTNDVVVAELKLQGSNSGLIQKNDAFQLGRFRLRDEVYTYLNNPEFQTMLELAGFSVVKDTGLSNYRIRLSGQEIPVFTALLASIGQHVDFPPEITFTEVDALVSLSAPWSLLAAQSHSIWMTEADIQTATVKWGGATVSLNGVISISKDGVLNGTITLDAPDWRNALALVIFDDADQYTAIESFVMGFADGDHLNVPLVLANGKLSIGPFDITDVPPLSLP